MNTTSARSRSRSSVWLAVGVLCVAVLPGNSTQSAPQDQPRPTFRTEANYVRVDVYATSSNGTPILDLRREEFRLLEDRTLQTIEQFAPVVIRAAGIPSTRTDPRSPEASRQAATEPRARVFVLFLDVMHVDGTVSQRIAGPLIDALRKLIGPDDLVAIVTPQTSARSITFTRQISTIEDALNRPWGVRDRTDIADPVERRYADCYPGVPPSPTTIAPDLGIAQEMILRRREALTFDALEELVTYLRDVREERKAVITITNGWRVYRPNQTLTRAIRTDLPSAPPAGFDPRLGKLSTDPLVTGDRASACDADRMRLAQLDHAARFREMLDTANRSNVSFYPVDPRGVVVFDDDIVPVAGVGQNPTLSPVEDATRLAERHTALRTMAESTDGVAVIETGNFAPALRRITDDLSAYYLLGYYSTGKLDGKFHAITVSVTRPGVQIRARRGYLAATTIAPVSEAAPGAAASAEAQAVSTALASLSTIAREPSLFLQAAVTWPGGRPSISAVVEIGRASLAADWARGGEADLLLIDPSGNTAGSARATIAAGAASTRIAISPRALPPGSYDLRVRARGASASAASNESTRIVVPASPEGAGAVLFRRGPTTGNREAPTADLRFRRSDTLRILLPASSSTNLGGTRLLDRTGKALGVPVEASMVEESDASRWISAQAALAPLAPGDYLLEVSVEADGAQKRILTALRVVP